METGGLLTDPLPSRQPVSPRKPACQEKGACVDLDHLLCCPFLRFPEGTSSGHHSSPRRLLLLARSIRTRGNTKPTSDISIPAPRCNRTPSSHGRRSREIQRLRDMPAAPSQGTTRIVFVFFSFFFSLPFFLLFYFYFYFLLFLVSRRGLLSHMPFRLTYPAVRQHAAVLQKMPRHRPRVCRLRARDRFHHRHAAGRRTLLLAPAPRDQVQEDRGWHG